MAKVDATKDYYAILKVAPTAAQDEIKKAFKKLALLYHPDRNPDNVAESVLKFQAIQEAHEILTDPSLRLKYDNERRKRRPTVNLHHPSPAPRQRPAQPGRYATADGFYSYQDPYARSYRPPPPNPPRPPPQPQNRRPPQPSNPEDFKWSGFRPPSNNRRPANTRPKEADPRENATAWQKMKPQKEKPDEGAANNASAPFGRSKSTRVPRNGFDPAALGPEHEPPAPKSSYRSAYERHAPAAPDDEVPFTEGEPRVRTPYASTRGERTTMFADGLGRSASMRTPPKPREESPKQAGPAPESGRKPERRSFAGNATRPFTISSSDESDVEEIPKTSFRPSPRSQKTQAAPPTNGSTKGQTSLPQEPGPNAHKSRSAESINLKFGDTNWQGYFTGAPNVSPMPNKRTTSKGRISPTRGRPSSRPPTGANRFAQTDSKPSSSGTGIFGINPFENIPSAPFSTSWDSEPERKTETVPAPSPNKNQDTERRPESSSAAHPAKFPTEEWQRFFKDSSWSWEPPKETSPRRGPATTKRSKNVPRKQSTQPPVIDLTGEKESAEANGVSSSRPKYQAFAEDVGTDSDAMDIDPVPTPSTEVPKASPKQPQPLHRQTASIGSEGGIRISTTPPIPAPAATNGASSTGLDAFTGLKNVEPLTPKTNGAGISVMADLGSSLPFPSKPSSVHPTKVTVAQRLKMPTLPVAPDRPDVKNQAQYSTYLKKMDKYFKEYQTWYAQIVGHFTARQKQLESELDPNWLHNSGEKTTTLGFESYMKGLEEDKLTREMFNLGCERHENAMQVCKEVRLLAKRASKFDTWQGVPAASA